MAALATTAPQRYSARPARGRPGGAVVRRMSRLVAGWSRSLLGRRSLLVRGLHAATLRQLAHDSRLVLVSAMPSPHQGRLAGHLRQSSGGMPRDGEYGSRSRCQAQERLIGNLLIIGAVHGFFLLGVYPPAPQGRHG